MKRRVTSRLAWRTWALLALVFISRIVVLTFLPEVEERTP